MFLRKSPVQKMIAGWKAILAFSIIFSLLGGIAMLIFLPLEYRADGQVYIISGGSYNIDAYTAVKSSERVGENIARIITTEDFYNRVITKDNTRLDKTYFTKLEERKRRDLWEDTVDATVEYGTGILNIAVYHEDKDQVKYLADAIINTLESEGNQYVGGNVAIRTVNQPIVTKFPVRPNILLNSAILFVLSLLGAGMVVGMKK